MVYEYKVNTDARADPFHKENYYVILHNHGVGFSKVGPGEEFEPTVNKSRTLLDNSLA